MESKHKESIKQLLAQIENLAERQYGLIISIKDEKGLTFNDALLTLFLRQNLLQIIVKNDSNFPNGNSLI